MRKSHQNLDARYHHLREMISTTHQLPHEQHASRHSDQAAPSKSRYVPMRRWIMDSESLILKCVRRSVYAYRIYEARQMMMC